MPPAASASTQSVRGTQSFVHTLSACWRRPSLTALEVAWRWLIGIPAAAVIYVQLHKALLAATAGTLDPARLGLDPTLLNDPVGALAGSPLGAAAKFTGALATVRPYLEHFAIWLLPLLLVAWIVVSSFGRTFVLRRAAAAGIAPPIYLRIVTVMALHTIRVAALAAVFALWFRGMTAASAYAVAGPVARNQDPNLILYCACAIVLTLGLFTAWAFVSWIFTIAPLLAMLRNLNATASLRAAFHLGPLQSRLMEINLVLGVVKIALIVLAMVFSATPLPFQSVTTPAFLAWWWAGVTLLYLLWSDFFHVARLLGYLQLWQTFQPREI